VRVERFTSRLVGVRVPRRYKGDLEQRGVPAAGETGEFCERFAAIKLDNKVRLAAVIQRRVGIEVDPALPTGRAVVSLRGGSPRFEIPEGVAFDAIDGAAASRAAREWRPSVVAFGTLALRSPASRAALATATAAGALAITVLEPSAASLAEGV
jgi:hypothetical protein